MDRRTFLKRGLFGGAVLAVGGVSLGAWQGTGMHAPTEPLRVLDAFAFSVVAAAAEAVIPGGNPVVLAHRVDLALQHSAPEAQADFNALARALNSPLMGALLDLRFTPFLQLSVDGRAAALQAWGDSRLALRKSGYHALRKLIAAAHYADAATWAAIGYPGPPTESLRGGMDR